MCLCISTVDPALDAVLKEYNERPNYKNSKNEEKFDPAQKFELNFHESDDDPGRERVLPLDEEVIKRHRLCLDEIHAIPRFKDYEPGLPNEVLCHYKYFVMITFPELETFLGFSSGP